MDENDGCPYCCTDKGHIMDKEGMQDRSIRIWDIAMETDSPFDGLILLCSTTAAFAIRHAIDKESSRKALLRMIQTAWEGNDHMFGVEEEKDE